MTSIAENTLTADDIAAQYAAQQNPAPAPAPKPTAPKLPEKLEVENYSQARRICLSLFGPLVRIKNIVLPDGTKGVEISLPGVLGVFGKTFKEAIEGGMAAAATPMTDDESYYGWDKVVMPVRTRNLTVERRMRLTNVLPAAYQGDEQMSALFGVLGLYDHQLFEAQKLLTATTEGKMELREVAAKDLKRLLDIGAKRFQREAKKASKAK